MDETSEDENDAMSSPGARIDPMSFPGVRIYRPRDVIPRIVRQGGRFTIHNPAGMSLVDFHEKMPDQVKSLLSIEQIVIARDYRDLLLCELAFYGVNSASLFPDLDGLSAFLNWNAGSRGFSR